MGQQTAKLLLTRAQRKAVAEILPAFTERLKLDKQNSRAIAFTTEELVTIRKKAEASCPHAENGMKRKSLRHVGEATTKALGESEGIGSIPVFERLYQFKVTLLEFEPLIWRRVQVKNCTLDKLHERIQTAMGWTNSHLHQFEINGDRYGDPQLLDDGFEDFECVNSRVTSISEIVPKDGKRFRFLYEYDFGDGWEHEVLFEGCLRAKKGGRYPMCMEGENNCPPEDVGGVWGYAEFLEVIGNPNHEQHDDFLEWAGKFDPKEFDAEETTRIMRRGLPDWRQYK